MFVIDRKLVCERLRITEGTSYRMIPASGIPYIVSDAVVNFLNRKRRGGEEEVNYIPSDIITPEEAEKITGIPASKLVLWTRRSKRCPPHYKFSSHAIRFRNENLKDWIRRMVKCKKV